MRVLTLCILLGFMLTIESGCADRTAKKESTFTTVGTTIGGAESPTAKKAEVVEHSAPEDMTVDIEGTFTNKDTAKSFEKKKVDSDKKSGGTAPSSPSIEESKGSGEVRISGRTPPGVGGEKDAQMASP